MTDFAQRTIDLARQNVAEGGRPFATVIVQRRRSPRRKRQQGRPDERPNRPRRDPRDPGGMHEAGHRAPGRRHHLRDGQPVPDVPGLAVLLLPKEVVFLINAQSYEQYYLDDRKYFEVSTFYDEYAKELGPATPADAIPAPARRGGRLPILVSSKTAANANRRSSRPAETAA